MFSLFSGLIVQTECVSERRKRVSSPLVPADLVTPWLTARASVTFIYIFISQTKGDFPGCWNLLTKQMNILLK